MECLFNGTLVVGWQGVIALVLGAWIWLGRIATCDERVRMAEPLCARNANLKNRKAHEARRPLCFYNMESTHWARCIRATEGTAGVCG